MVSFKYPTMPNVIGGLAKPIYIVMQLGCIKSLANIPQTICIHEIDSIVIEQSAQVELRDEKDLDNTLGIWSSRLF